LTFVASEFNILFLQWCKSRNLNARFKFVSNLNEIFKRLAFPNGNGLSIFAPFCSAFTVKTES